MRFELPTDQKGNTIPVFPVHSGTQEGTFTDQPSKGYRLLRANHESTVSLTDADGTTTVTCIAGEVIGIVGAVSITTSSVCKMS